MSSRPLNLSHPDDALWMALARNDEPAALAALGAGARPEQSRPMDWDEDAQAFYAKSARENRRFNRPEFAASALEAASFWRMPQTVERMLTLERAPMGADAQQRVERALAAALLASLPFRGQKEAAKQQDQIADRLLAALPRAPWVADEDCDPLAIAPAAPAATEWASSLARQFIRRALSQANWISWRWLQNNGALEHFPSLPAHGFAASHEPQIAALIAAQWPQQSVSRLRRVFERQETKDMPSDPWSSEARTRVSLATIETVEELADSPGDEKKWLNVPTRLQMSESIALDVAVGNLDTLGKKLNWLSRCAPEKFDSNLSDAFSFLWEQGGPSGLSQKKDAAAGWAIAMDACAERSERDWGVSRENHERFAQKTQSEFWQKAFYHARLNEAGAAGPTPFSVGRSALASGQWSALNFWRGLALHSGFQQGKITWRQSEALATQTQGAEALAEARERRHREEKHEARDRGIAVEVLRDLSEAIKAAARTQPDAQFDVAAERFAKKGFWFGVEAIFNSGLLADSGAASHACFVQAATHGQAATAEKIIDLAAPALTEALRNPQKALKIKEALKTGSVAHADLRQGKTKSGKTRALTAADELRLGSWSRLVARVEALDLSASLDLALPRKAEKKKIADESRAAEKTRRL